MPAPDCLLVQVTCPDGNAERIAKTLVEARIAACVNIISGARSIYRWDDKVHTDSESLLLIKTTRLAYPDVVQMVVDLHPYEVPELVAFDITDGLETYLSWLQEAVSP